MEHPHVEVQVAGVDRELRGELAVRQRACPRRRAPGGPSAAADGRAPSAARAGRARGRLAAPAIGSGVLIRSPVFAAAAASRKTSTGTGASRVRLAGTSRLISPPNARRRRRPCPAPVTRKTMRLADWIVGSVSVTRSTNGSRPAGPQVDAAVRDLELRRAGEERRHVAVAAEPEQHEVERRRRPGPRRSSSAAAGGELAADPVDRARAAPRGGRGASPCASR